jgi:hypothetical protein
MVGQHAYRMGDLPTWVQVLGVVATLGYLGKQINKQSDQLKLTREQVENKRKSDASQLELLRQQVGNQER